MILDSFDYAEICSSATITIGDYVIGPAYSGKPEYVGIYKINGEGGDFSRESLALVLADFYKENF